MPRPRLILRGLAFVACALPVGALVLAACDDAGTLNAGIDSGSSTADATTDATPDATEEASSPDSSETEASCVVDAGPLDDADIYAGFEIVLTHRCKSCHGDGLYGNNDGVPSPTTEGGLAYPPNLTPDPATGLACWTNEQIENAILNGIDNMDMPLCPPMPHFGSPSAGTLQLTPMQVAQVVQYLRSLPPYSNEVPNTPNCWFPEAGPIPEAGPDSMASEAGTDGGNASDGSSSADGSATDGPSPDGTSGDAGTVGDAAEAGD